MSDNEQDAFGGTEEELHRRDLSRVFLKYLRPAARLRAEYQLALEELVRASGIQRDMAEDDLEQDLDWDIESLVERCPDPLLIEGEISETDAREILDGEGAFRNTIFELDEEESAALNEAIEKAENPSGIVALSQRGLGRHTRPARRTPAYGRPPPVRHTGASAGDDSL